MKKKLNRKYLGIIFILFTIFLMFSGTTVWGALTQYEGDTPSEFEKTYTEICSAISQVGFSVVGALPAMLLSVVALMVFVTLQNIFVTVGATDQLWEIPFPDTIIFNKMELFDANFINPVESTISPIYVIRTTISSVYDTFVIIAIALFTIIAMIIGIKLALATLASEKAKYKQAIGCWISGILLLVCLKWVLAGMFKINEKIVQEAYEISTQHQMQFEVMSWASFPLIGSTIATVAQSFGAKDSALSCWPVPGYLGLTLKFLLEGIGGNFIGSLVAFVVLSQTVAIIAMYLKRVFYCLLLGITAPLIVAVDTFNRSIGKSSQILTNWFKQLALTIFMQSFHAIFLLILMMFMVQIIEVVTNKLLSSLLIIILTAGLIKFEKVFKQLFGISEAMMGDLQGGAMKAMATMGAVAKAGRAIGDNGKKLNDAHKRKKDAIANRSKLEQKQNILKAKMGIAGNAGNQSTTENTKVENAKDNKASTGMGGDDEIKSILRDINNQMKQKQYEENEKQLRAYDKQLGQAEADIASAKFAFIATPASIGAGTAVGLGADNMAAGASFTTALDHAFEKVGQRGADKTRSRLYDEAKAQGRENPEILRQTTVSAIKEGFQNLTGYRIETDSNGHKHVTNDAVQILLGTYDSSKTYEKTIKDYRYIKDRTDKGHKAISSSVDNL